MSKTLPAVANGRCSGIMPQRYDNGMTKNKAPPEAGQKTTKKEE
ncbi:hypothetical protein [Shewanella sp. YIC-542]